jgi:hypothetical protein
VLRDGERAECVVAHDAAGVADHVGVALLQAEHARRVESGVHARQHRHLACRGQREIALVERARVGLVVLEEAVGGAHL